MRAFWLLALAWAACSSAHAAAVISPIAPASQGRLQCYSPDIARKTCKSLSAYKTGANNAIQDTATALISQTPPITMTTTSPVTINKTNQVCEVIRPQDIDAATFTFDNQPADAERTTALRQQVQSAMTAFFGHEICTAFVPDRGALLAKISVDGTSQPTKTQTVMWVSPAAGYKVGP